MINTLSSALTAGSFNGIKEFTNKHIAPKCTLLTPTVADRVTSREFVHQFFESPILLHLELICEFHNFIAETNDSMFCTYSYDGTYFDPENKSLFTNRDNDSDAKTAGAVDSTLWQNDHVNGHKFEKDEVENREKYAQLMQEHKPVEVTVRGC